MPEARDHRYMTPSMYSSRSQFIGHSFFEKFLFISISGQVAVSSPKSAFLCVTDN